MTEQAARATVDTCCSSDSCCASASPASGPDAGWSASARRARLLAWLSLGWMTAEGAVGLVAGFAAGSAALIGWAFGSAIEGLASAIVIWRFTGVRTHSETAERRAQQLVAVSFWLLAPYIAAEAAVEAAGGHGPQRSWLGIAVTAASLVFMPALGVAKRRLAKRLDSGATAGEGMQNYLCAAQAAAVLLALAVVAAVPAAWWIDPVIAFAIAGWSVREGIESWRGEECGC